MGFVIGAIVGVIVGGLAVSYNPGLAERVQAHLAGVTTIILRGTEEAADTVGDAAKAAAEDAERMAAESDRPGEDKPGPAVEDLGETPEPPAGARR